MPDAAPLGVLTQLRPAPILVPLAAASDYSAADALSSVTCGRTAMRPTPVSRVSLPLAALLVAASVAATAAGQDRFWAQPASGDWTNPLSWSHSDGPVRGFETVGFDVFGSYDVRLPTDSHSLVRGMTVQRGDLRLVSNGAASALLTAQNHLTFGGGLSLPTVELINTRLETQGPLTLQPGATLFVGDDGIHAASTRIDSGATFTPTTLRLLGSQSVDLGDLTLAEAGGSTRSAVLNLELGADVQIGNLALATGSGESSGELSVSNSQLVQRDGATAVIGQAAEPGVVGTGVVAVFGNSGAASFDRVRIASTGQLLNVGGRITFRTELDVDGGVYEERNRGRREFFRGAGLRIGPGGSAKFVAQTLSLTFDQPLSIDGGALSSEGGTMIASAATLSGAVRIDGDLRFTLGSGLTIAESADVVLAHGLTTQGSAAGRTIGDGATLRVGGNYRGDGLGGPGEVIFESAVEMSGPGPTFGGRATLEETATLVAGYGGLGSDPTFRAADSVSLGGRLLIQWLNETSAPEPGSVFEVVSAPQIEGAFTEVETPAPVEGLGWRLESRSGSVHARVGRYDLQGDYNGDGLINAADYTLWRDTLGATGPLQAADADANNSVDAADYDAWTAAYGPPPTPVPEPGSGVAALACAAAAMVWGRGSPRVVAPRRLHA